MREFVRLGRRWRWFACERCGASTTDRVLIYPDGAAGDLDVGYQGQRVVCLNRVSCARRRIGRAL